VDGLCVGDVGGEVEVVTSCDTVTWRLVVDVLIGGRDVEGVKDTVRQLTSNVVSHP
jgi:hypothetical protein